MSDTIFDESFERDINIYKKTGNNNTTIHENFTDP